MRAKIFSLLCTKSLSGGVTIFTGGVTIFASGVTILAGGVTIPAGGNTGTLNLFLSLFIVHAIVTMV